MSTLGSPTPYPGGYRLQTVNPQVRGVNTWYFGDIASTSDSIFIHSGTDQRMALAPIGNGLSWDGTNFGLDMSVVQAKSPLLDELAAMSASSDKAIRVDANGNIVNEAPADFLSWLGGVSSAGSYPNPTWLESLAWAKILNKPTTLSGYGITDAYPLSGNPSGFLTSVPEQSFNSLIGRPTTLAGYGITDAYPMTGNPSNFLTGISGPQVIAALGFTPYSAANPSGFLSAITGPMVTTALGFTPYNATNPSAYINQAGARSAISVTTTGSSGAATYNSSTGVLNIPQYAQATPVISSPTFATSTAATQLSSTRWADVQYEYDATVTISLLSGQSITATLRYADNAGMSTNVVTVSAQTTNNAGVLGLSQTNTLKVNGPIPPGKYRQVTFSVTGGATAPSALKAGWELLN